MESPSRLPLLAGKRGVVLGVANKRSLAWGIAKAAAESGAELLLTYAGERFQRGVEELGSSIGVTRFASCDVTSDDDIAQLATTVGEEWDHVDFVVHAVAFAKREELTEEVHKTSRDGYHLAQDISSYSLTAVCRALKPLMEGGSSVVTLTYLGGPRVVPNYGVMGIAKAALEASTRYLAYDLGRNGIRVNALSAGPVKTLSASGVSKFSTLLDQMPERAPLRRNITQEEVGDAALFLLSDLSRAVTGDVLYVDAGYHVLGA